MSTEGTTAGWYPDPGGVGSLRWWDGTQWTEHLQPVPGPASQPTGLASQQPGYGAQPAGFGQPGFGGVPAGPWASGPVGSPRGLRAGRGANRYALIAIVVSALYLVVALASHVVLFGILPLLMSIRSMRARERLAPVALGLSIVVIVVALLLLV